MPVQLALVLQVGVFPLPEHLVGGDSDRVWKVKAARLVYHRYAQSFVGVSHQHMLGQSARFLSENQKAVVGEAYVAVAVSAFSREKEKAAAFVFLKKVV